LAIGKLTCHNSRCIDQIPGEFIEAGCRTIRCKIHKLISILNKSELLEEWKELISVPICKERDETDCINYRGVITFADYVQNVIHYLSVKDNSIFRGNYCGSSNFLSTQQVNY
jgi:hypothetical protein